MSTLSLFNPVLACTLLLAARASAQDAAPAQDFDARLARELAVPGGLSSDQVAERALATSFDVRARQSQLLAAAADADRALLGYLPVLTAAAGATWFTDTGVTTLGDLVVAPGQAPGPLPAGAELVNFPFDLKPILHAYALQTSLLVPVSDYFLRVAPSRSAAEHAERASSHTVDSTRSQVATDARVAYYGWVRAKLSLVISEQALADARAHLGDAKAAEDAGAASPADTLRVESQVARSELLVVNTRSLAAVSEERVRTLVHDASSAPFAIGEDIRQAPRSASAASQVSRLNELWSEAERMRPELKALGENALALQRSARVDRAGMLPRLDLLAAGTYANPNPRIFPPEDEFRAEWQAGVRLAWNITELPSAALRARANDARSAALDSERLALFDRIRVEVRAAAHALDDSGVALETTQRGLDYAEESYRVRRISYQNGASTSVELLDAETDLTRARLERLNAEIDARIARVRLDYAIGRALPGP
ncbi:MAG: TolC family protein [Polyangiaceae bacterium]